MGKDGLDAQHPVRDEDKAPAASDWAGRFLRRLPTPTWQTRETGLPTLVNTSELDNTWRIRFGGAAADPMETFAFEATPKAAVRYLAVAVPKSDVRPTAWLIYFRHTAQKKDFGSNLLELGAGDYLMGRMQVCKQIVLSKKNVGVIIPIALGSSGEFAGNQAFVTQCLHEIESSIYGSSTKLPLLGACNSDSIFELNKFLSGCPALAARLKAVYDFDGSYRLGTGAITLSVKGARTFRYIGAHSPTPETWGASETDTSFLARAMSGNPARVPLALSRWREHSGFKIIRPHDDARVNHKKGDPDNEVRKGDQGDANWLHHRIPSCMLQHGLASTSGI
jgi:hypothetical protein